MTVVSNSGPLIALAQIDHFELLRLLYGTLLVPSAVQEEVVKLGQNRPGAAEVEAANWIQIESIHSQVAVELLQERLDRGESEAIVLAIEQEADLLLIDEARGRQVVRAQGLNHVGTVGILILAKRRGLISSVTPQLDILIESGFRMSGQLYQTARKLAQEL